METLKAILGEGLAAPIRSELIMENRHGNGAGADPELLELQGRRITWTSETGENKWLNAEKIKLFTGGDTISGRLMYANEIISFPPTHTLIMLTNHRPRIKGDDAAIWSRLRNIPFLLSFVDNPQQRHERQKDPDLRESLEKEASGILAWLVQGCLNWQKEGLNSPAIVIDAGQEYRLSEYPLQQFINERCETGEGLKIQAGPLYDAFVEWFEETRGAKSTPPSLIKVSEQLQKIPGILREAGSRVVYFHGITLTDLNT